MQCNDDYVVEVELSQTQVIVEVDDPIVVQVDMGIPGPRGLIGPIGMDGKFYVSETPPLDPEEGDGWFNSNTSLMYLYYDFYWVETSSSFVGPPGPSGVLGIQNIDGGSASSVYNQNQLIDGGSSSSVYTQNQLVNGGMAGTF